MISRISSIHLELSSLCNASCPQCGRNNKGGAVNPRLPLVYLTRADIEAIFTPSLLADLDHLKVCGNYGDGASAPDAVESFRFLKSQKADLRIELHTNGGLRDPAWWHQLAKTVDVCVFGIDGLEDTNHLYRRGVSWFKLRQNVEAFIEAGGAAEWQFLIFKHNEHQVEEARALAASLGFRQFVTKRTHRFFKGGRLSSRQPVLSRNGAIEYFIELPENREANNPAMLELSATIASDRPSSAFANYLESTPIHCKAIERQQIYISSEGLVFPCCWTAGIYTFNSKKDEVLELLDRMPGGKDSINAKLILVRDIVQGPFFREIANSWAKSPIEGKLTTCAMHCGQCDMSRAQRSLALEC